MDAYYADDTMLLVNTPAQAETLLHSLGRAATGIDRHVNADKTEYMCFNQRGDISTLSGSSLKLVDKFIYLGSSVSSTAKNVNTRLAKARTPIDRLSVIWKSDRNDEIKRNFFHATQECCELYWTSFGGSTAQISHNTVIYHEKYPRRTRHAGHCWRSKDELISDILLYTPSHGRAKAGRPARNYIKQFFAGWGCSLEDLPGAMDDRDGWQERVRKIRTGSATWWCY